MHAENTDDTSKGFVYIADSKFTVNCKGDGIDAVTTSQIENGTFNITSNRGSSSSSSTDSASVKGIKAGGDITISGGTFNLTCEDDGLHSNSNVTVSGGTFTISTGDDGIYADSKTSISGGTINITESYEGIEGTEVEMTSIIYGSGGMGGPGSMDGRNMGNGDMNGNEMGGPGGDMRGGPQMR